MAGLEQIAKNEFNNVIETEYQNYSSGFGRQLNLQHSNLIAVRSVSLSDTAEKWCIGEDLAQV